MRSCSSLIRYISTATKPLATKRGKVVTYYEGLPHIKSLNTLMCFFSGHVTNQKRLFSTTAMPEAIKLSSMMT